MSSLFASLPVIVSYYTKDTPYEKEVSGLIESCRKFSLDYRIEAIPDQGGWEKNCSIKPYFLRDVLREINRPLLWVDADAIFLQTLKFEEFMFSDLSMFFENTRSDPRFRVRSGTVYINATDSGKAALDLWCRYSDTIEAFEEKCLPFQDQVSLYFTSLAIPSAVRPLPLRYCSIFPADPEGIDPEGVVIQHYQASRRFHKKITIEF